MATKAKTKSYVMTTGRRREAVARVRLYANDDQEITWGDTTVKKGDIIVNSLPVGKYFSGEVAHVAYMEPFRVTNTIGKFAVTVKVVGGGKSGQLDAMVHGISRALDEADSEKNHPILKKRGFLTRDARIRQRRKVGMGGKSRRKKQSPKR